MHIHFFREQEEKEKVLIVREITGRGVFECKKALRNNGWDIDEAVKWLSEHDCFVLMIMKTKKGMNM